jgi:hypothetical protein
VKKRDMKMEATSILSSRSYTCPICPSGEQLLHWSTAPGEKRQISPQAHIVVLLAHK